MNSLITYGDSHLSLGTLIGLPVMILCALLLIAGAFLGAAVPGYSNRLRIGWGIAAAIGTALVCGIGIFIGMYPLSGEYHHWQTISGTVDSTNSRFLAKSKGTDQKFVVTFEGSDQQYGCNDTRCATVRKGDQLSITCKRVNQWFGTDGYDCNFESYKPAGVNR